jgi:2-methylisocitrate lyase-like PEP mutase family enzyme
MTTSPPSRADKVVAFRELHTEGFIIPNPFDQGSAKLLEVMGFKALASTSAGFAHTLGRADGSTRRTEVLGHLQALCSTVSIPVSADLENCYGDAPEQVAETITLAAACGCAGGSVEDATGSEADPLYGFELAVERVRAAAEAARGVHGGFVLTARAENYLVGRPDLKDTIRRLQAYQEAGADVLFAPGLTQAEDIRTVLKEVDRPLNVILVGGLALTASELIALGVRRLSTGGGLARAAYGELIRAAGELQSHGTRDYLERAVSSPKLNAILAGIPDAKL